MRLRTDNLAATPAPVAIAPPSPAMGAPARSSMFAALAYRDFRYLWGSNVAWQLSHWVFIIAQGWLVFDLTNSPFMLGLVGFASGAPMLFIAPLGGAMADRLDRRKVLFVIQSGHVFVGLAQAMLALGGWIQVWHILLIALTSGTLSCISAPARQTLALDVVGKRHLPNAIAMNSIGQNSIRVMGPALGGVLIGALGVTGAFFFSAGGVVAAAGFALMMRPTAHSTTPRRERLLASIAEGVRYGWGDKDIRAVLLVAGVSTFFALSFTQLMPAFAKNVLGLGPTGYGLIMAASGIGALVGSVYIAWASDAPGKGRMLMIAQLTLAGCLLLFAVSRFLPLSYILIMGVGVGSAVWMALTNTLLQTYCAPEYQGRVMALYMITFGLQTAGSLAVGAVAGAIGVAWAIGGFSAVVVLFGLWMTLFSRRVWRM